MTYTVTVSNVGTLGVGGVAVADLFPAILTNVAKLRCDMYDNGLLPIALANKLISLADHPSSKILEKFAKAALAAT